MRFHHEGKRITLRGISANNSHCPTVSPQELHQMIEQGAVAQLLTLAELLNDKEQSDQSIPPSI